MPLLISVRLSGQAEEEFIALLPHYADRRALVEAALHALHRQVFAADHTGAYLGSGPAFVAQQGAACFWCEVPIVAGDQIVPVYVIGGQAGVFAHQACDESD